MHAFNFHESEWRDSEANVAELAKSYVRELKAFDELETAILAGEHFPSVVQLLDGHAPFQDSLSADVAVWVARSRAASLPESLREDLRDFGIWPSVSGAIRIHDATAGLDVGNDAIELSAIRERAAWYATIFGDQRLRNILMSIYAAGLDHRRLCYRLGLENRFDYPVQADGWTPGLQAATSADGVLVLRRLASISEAHDWLRENHAQVVRFAKGRLPCETLYALANPKPSAATATESRAVSVEEWLDSPDARVAAADRQEREREEAAVATETGKAISELLEQPKHRVIGTLEVAGTSDQKAFLGTFAKMAMLRVPLVVAPDVATIERDLTGLWPHAEDVIRRILSDVVPGKPVRLRPTLLVGEPGSGKTRLLGALTRRLGLPSVAFPCASVADGSFGGTPAQWSTRRASVPLELIRSSKTANPAVVLDELEKSGVSSANGSLLNALLPMLELHSAEAYFETALETNVDLSMVSFLATANTLAGIPDPLRDRFRVLVMPNPSMEHLDSLVEGVVLEVLEERGVPGPFMELLAPDEVEVVGRAWGGGSLRKLRTAVEAALDHRDRSRTMQ